MKYRQSFISNSSSSSFIIAIKDFPNSEKKFKEMLLKEFGADNSVPYKADNDIIITWDQISKDFFQSLRKGKNPGMRKLVQEIESAYLYDIEDRHWYGRDRNESEEDYRRNQTIQNINILKKKKTFLKNFLDQHKGDTFFIISYADEDGSFGSAMEHEIVPGSFPNIHCSHH